MRPFRFVRWLAAAACAAALCASPAAAKESTPREFEASKTGRTTGEALSTQTFKLKPITITCAAAKSSGTVTALKSPTLIDVVKYSECESNKASASFSPVEWEFNADGSAKILNTVKIRVSALKCLVIIEPQRLPESEESKLTPFSYGHKKLKAGEGTALTISSRVHKEGIEYSFEKGICGKLEETEGENGEYTGSLLDGLEGGSLTVSK